MPSGRRRVADKVVMDTGAGSGIRVDVVTRGGVKTAMWEKETFLKELMAAYGGTERAFAAMAGEMPSQHSDAPQKIAVTIRYLASDESSHLTGTEIRLDRRHKG